MDLIDEIKQRLSKYPEARYKSGASSITVLPVSDEGFPVGLSVNLGGGFTVSFAGWHDDFHDGEEALNVFAFGLSDECRLREHRRGNFAHKWTVESKVEEEWIDYSTTGVLFFPFWKKARVCVLQNKVITRQQ